ncbi:amidohydrolase family protein [Collimonas sp. H4R21]|uniref:Amidohydrolase family protein n=1 Tax=Collimonas rhizosphaerae TaxID=3126357 RepID=A0ABU9Q2X1_9BURK
MKTIIAIAGLGAALPSMAQTLPFRVFDSHAHFYTDDFLEYPLHPEHAYMGAKRLIEIVADRPNTPEYVLKLWDENGVEAGAGVQYGTAYQADNSYVLSVAHHYPQRIAPVVMLDTNSTAAPKTLRKLVKRDSVVGIRLAAARDKNGAYPGLDSPRTLKVWAVANSLHLPVIVFPSVRGPDPYGAASEAMQKVLELARRYPDTKIVLDHFGWPGPSGAPDYGIEGVYRRLAAQKNIFFKVTTVNFNALGAHGISTSGFLRHAVDTYGAHRIMWGSDLGNTPLPYAEIVDKAIAATALLNEPEREQVLRNTGYEIFGRPEMGTAEDQALSSRFSESCPPLRNKPRTCPLRNPPPAAAVPSPAAAAPA